MEARLDYSGLAPEGMAKMRELEHYLNAKAGLEANLLEFVRLLASKLNGCHLCIALHTAELHRHNETQDRIDDVTGWRGSTLFTHRERAALAWAEEITNIQSGHAPDVVYNELKSHFTQVEIVNLTLSITSINAWNRLTIALGEHAGPR